MFKGKNGTIYLDRITIDCHTKLTLIDRLRLICGGRIAVRFEVYTQKHFGRYEAQSIFMIEKLFRKAKAIDTAAQEADACPEPQKA